MIPELLVEQSSSTAECPLWHQEEQALYWVDIPNAKLFRYQPATKELKVFDTEIPIGGFTIQKDGSLLLFMAKGAIKIFNNGKITTVIESVPGEEDSRFNDVAADPAGRVFCGTMSSENHPGTLYRLDHDLQLVPVAENIGTSNGIAFSPDHKYMYHTDTRKHIIYRYRYDINTGEISDKEDFIIVDEGLSRPDGLTVDSEGNLWSARWDGYSIVKYSPDGEVSDRISFPVFKVSSMIFGGPEYKDLYVTTAGGADKTTNGKYAGSVFHVKTDVTGLPEPNSDINI